MGPRGTNDRGREENGELVREVRKPAKEKTVGGRQEREVPCPSGEYLPSL